jgi:hypothetical protein
VTPLFIACFAVIENPLFQDWVIKSPRVLDTVLSK